MGCNTSGQVQVKLFNKKQLVGYLNENEYFKLVSRKDFQSWCNEALINAGQRVSYEIKNETTFNFCDYTFNEIKIENPTGFRL